ncbi:outer membrane lipoprotein chaperone LolA [Colwellia sp. MEBiC06753]
MKKQFSKTLIASALFLSITIVSPMANADVVNALMINEFALATADTSVEGTSLNDQQAKAALLAQLATIENLSANFVQTIFDDQGDLLQEGQGYFTLAKPNKLHWQTEQPDESTIVSDGQTLWLFDPFIEQVTAYSLAKSIQNTPILLLTSNDPSLWQHYNVQLLAEHQFLVISKDQDAQVKQLTLSFAEHMLSSFTIVDATGQQSHFQLAAVKKNQTIDNKLFHFEIPEGAILDDQQ